MDALPRPVVTPEAEVVIHGLPAWEVVRQCPPADAFADDVEDGVDDLAARDGRRATAGLGCRDEILDACPLGVTEVGWVSLSCHPTILPPQPLFKPLLIASCRTWRTVLATRLGIASVERSPPA